MCAQSPLGGVARAYHAALMICRSRTLRTIALTTLTSLAACAAEPEAPIVGAPVVVGGPVGATTSTAPRRATIGVGDTLRLTLPPSSRRDRLMAWTSSDPAVASVSPQGVVVGLRLGTSTVIGTSRGGVLRLLLTVATDSVVSPPDTTTPPDTTAPPPPPSGALGLNAPLGRRLFPDNNPWNQPVDTAQIDPNSAAIIANIGETRRFHPDFGANWNGGPFGIPYVVVSGSQARVPVTFEYDDESDPGPYPVPPNPPIEGGPSSTGDRHILIVDRDNWTLYELYAAYPQGAGWRAGSGAIFNLNSNALRPAGWTSADAAGLPILPGLVRYEEVANGAIEHALRFTVSRSRRAYIPPATHWASSDTSSLRPPMGMRVRLKASVNISGYPASAQVICARSRSTG